MNPLVPALALTLAACTSSSTVLPASSAESTVQRVVERNRIFACLDRPVQCAAIAKENA